MRKRLGLIGVLVAVAMFVAPATASAGGDKTWQVMKNTCTYKYAAYGYGKSVFTVRLNEWGNSGTARFRVRAWAQYQHGSWTSVDNWQWIYSVQFGDGNGSNYFQHKFVYQWGSDHYTYYGRLKVRGEWLNSLGNVIAHQNLYGTAC